MSSCIGEILQEGYFDANPGLRPDDVNCWLGPLVNEIARPTSYEYNLRYKVDPSQSKERYSCEFVVLDTTQWNDIPNYPCMPAQRFQVFVEVMVRIVHPASNIRIRHRPARYSPHSSEGEQIKVYAYLFALFHDI